MIGNERTIVINNVGILNHLPNGSKLVDDAQKIQLDRPHEGRQADHVLQTYQEIWS